MPRFFQDALPPSSFSQSLTKLIAAPPEDTPVSFVEAGVGKKSMLIPLVGKRLLCELASF